MRRSWLLLLLAGCVGGKGDLDTVDTAPSVTTPDPTDPLDTADTVDTVDTLDSAAPEECNGDDDDGDGQVDEGYPDVDADGVADCVDDDCEVAPVPSVKGAPVTAPWDAGLAWETNVGMAAAVTPVVAYLRDADGDGLIGAADRPDLVVGTTNGLDGALHAVAGDGAGLLWSISGMAIGAGVAAGDLDGDGWPEIVSVDDAFRAVAFRGDGTVLWRSEPVPGAALLALQPLVTDVDGDGGAEVVIADAILDGADGALHAQLEGRPHATWWAPSAADLDGDGAAEVIAHGTVYRGDGSAWWQADIPAGMTMGFSAVFDADGDPEGEVAFVFGTAGAGALQLYDHDGTQLLEVGLVDIYGSAPCVGDVDGDGEVELAVVSDGYAVGHVSLYELDGTLRWVELTDDVLSAISCSMFDFDGDGALEVVLADAAEVRVLDGLTGATLWSDGHSSPTVFEYPVVVDLDADGSAEIVSSYGVGSFGGVAVWSHRAAQWAAAGSTWGRYDFHPANLTDGGAPAESPGPWTLYNGLRSRPAVAPPNFRLDLAAVAGASCIAACPDGVARAAWGVANLGEADIPAGISAAVYADGALLDVIALPAVPMGAVVPLPDAVGEGVGAFVVRVDDDGAGGEILGEVDEVNNELTLLPPACP